MDIPITKSRKILIDFGLVMCVIRNKSINIFFLFNVIIYFFVEWKNFITIPIIPFLSLLNIERFAFLFTKFGIK